MLKSITKNGKDDNLFTLETALKIYYDTSMFSRYFVYNFK